jgi:hypothetical protein
VRDETPNYAVLFNRNREEIGSIFIRDAMLEENIGIDPEIKIRGCLVRTFPAEHKSNPPRSMTPKTVIFNPPATIVLWKDGTKTTVKCDETDRYIPVLGLALCYMKKSLGNTSRELNKALREAEREIESKIFGRKEK